MLSLRIFVSSPSDVNEERVLTRRVVERLQYEFRGRVALEPVFWEHELVLATDSFQAQIPRPSECADLAVFILWSRMGTPLPDTFRRPDGSRYGSGTEYEFEDALNGHRERGVPDILVYRKGAEVLASISRRKEALDQIAQHQAVEAFIAQWFHGADGSFEAAFHLFSEPADLEERLEAHLRRWIAARLEAAGAAPATGRELWQGSPFRGLESFEAEHALVFCGRTRAVSGVIEALRAQADDGHPFVLIIGMSGAGKSSLVRAGLLPTITQPRVIAGVDAWRSAVLRPHGGSRDPLLNLAAALMAEGALPELAAAGIDAAQLARSLREGPEALTPSIAMALAAAARTGSAGESTGESAGAPGTGDGAGDGPGDAKESRRVRLLLLVDQLEELFTYERISAGERAAFVRALGALARSGLVWVIATLRGDYYPHCGQLPDEFGALVKGRGLYELRPPSPAEIAQMIRQPARMAGLAFEQRGDTEEGLDEELRDACAANPAALPLLEFTLDELQKKAGERRLLTFADYEALGEIEGAITQRAEDEFRHLSREAQDALPALLTALVRVGLEDEGVSQRRVPLARIAAHPGAQELIDAFVAARLFAADRRADGRPVVGVAHEALLHRWQRVQDWIADNADLLRTQARLAAAAAVWDDAGREEAYLLSDRRGLGKVAALLADHRDKLRALDVAFIEASLIRDRRHKRRRKLQWAALAGVLALSAAAGLVWWDLHLRPHEAYYALFVRKFGVPVAVGPLSDAEARKRPFVYKVTRKGRRGLPTQIAFRNAKGACPSSRTSAVVNSRMSFAEIMSFDLSGYRWDGESDPDVCRYRFEYEGTHLASETGLDATGQVVYELEYDRKSRDMARYRGQGRAQSRRAASGAEWLQFEWVAEGDADAGLLKTVRFLDSAGVARPDETGIYGTEFAAFDRGGLPAEVWALDQDGNRTSAPATGQAGLRIDYAEREGLRARLTYLDLEGRAFRQPDLDIAAIEVQLDEPADSESFSFFDAKGMAHVVSAIGCASIAMVYDARGNIKQQDCRAADGRLRISPKWGYARLVQAYDEKNRVTLQEVYGADGKLMVHGEWGYAKLVQRYDEAGNITIVEVYGADGKLMVHGDWGYAKLVKRYDEAGNQTLEEAYGADGKLMVDVDDGYARLVQAYDEENRVILQEVYGADGKLMVHGEWGYAKLVQRYDEAGNQTLREVYGADGKLMVDPDWGYAKLVQRYDEAGNITLSEFYGADGKLMIHGEWGYAKGVKRYDEAGNETLTELYGADGKLMVHGDWGYAKLVQRYDEAGNKTLEETYGADGELIVPRKDYFARFVREPDAGGGRARAAYYDAAGAELVPKGVGIVGVMEGSVAEKVGLAPGDLIVAYDRRRFDVLQDFIDAAAAAGDADRELEVLRDGRRLSFDVPAGKLGIEIRLLFEPAE